MQLKGFHHEMVPWQSVMFTLPALVFWMVFWTPSVITPGPATPPGVSTSPKRSWKRRTIQGPLKIIEGDFVKWCKICIFTAVRSFLFRWLSPAKKELGHGTSGKFKVPNFFGCRLSFFQTLYLPANFLFMCGPPMSLPMLPSGKSTYADDKL